MNMKLIRKLKAVSVYDESDDENNNELSIAKFDSEPGFYQQVIRPMLAPGHEGELVSWLKNIGLIPQAQKCRNADVNDFCNVPMSWTAANSMDNYQWKCTGCSQKRKIRDNSIFHNVKCKFKDVIRVLLGWSKGNTEEMMANILSIRKPIVKVIYNIASNTAEKYIRSHSSEFKLGGPGVVVLIDTYPDGHSKIADQEYTQRCRVILCIAEIKNIPTRFWFQSLEHYHKTSPEQIECVNEAALKIVQQIVLPGSVVVANMHTTICSFDTLKALHHYYPTIVSTDAVARHNNAIQSLFHNLELIWEPALAVCQVAQSYPYSEVQAFLVRHIWRQRFGSESFEMLLNQLTY